MWKYIIRRIKGCTFAVARNSILRPLPVWDVVSSIRPRRSLLYSLKREFCYMLMFHTAQFQKQSCHFFCTKYTHDCFHDTHAHARARAHTHARARTQAATNAAAPTVTALRAGRSHLQCVTEQQFLSSPKRTGRLEGPGNLFSVLTGLKRRANTLTTHLHTVSRLRRPGACTVTARRGHGQLCPATQAGCLPRRSV
jgi:hypothetical protein